MQEAKAPVWGAPKAHLPFGSATLIETVVATLRPVFKAVYVVGRDRERLAGLGATLLIDDRDEQGPLVGLARGLSASDAPWRFAVGCDMPFLSPRVIRRMASFLDDCDVLAANVEGRIQPRGRIGAFEWLGVGTRAKQSCPR